MQHTPDRLQTLSQRIEAAIEFAALWHEGTYRKSGWKRYPFIGEDHEPNPIPVIAHCMTVGLLVQRAGWDEDTVSAAFLHDVLEDPNRFGAYCEADTLEARFGETVTAYVKALTEEKFDADGNPRAWKPRKVGYLRGLEAAPVEVMGISLADKLHNLYTINQTLVRGVDVFTRTENVRPLSAGPEEQQWFYRSILSLAGSIADVRLEGLRTALHEQLERFEQSMRR